MLNAARDGGVKRMVFASSSSVYGDTPILPKEEGMIPTPQSPYAVSKLAAEFYCRVFYRVYGLETVSLRYFNVYGKRQDPNSQYAAVIPKFVTSLIKGEVSSTFGDGGIFSLPDVKTEPCLKRTLFLFFLDKGILIEYTV